MENETPKEEKLEQQCVPVPLLIWLGQYIAAGILYSVAAFFTTIGLNKWWNKKQ